jgi:hypothetical protein
MADPKVTWDADEDAEEDLGFEEERRAMVMFGSLTSPRDEEVVEVKKPSTSSVTPSKHIMLRVGQGAGQAKDEIASVCAKATDPFIKSFGDPDSFDLKLVSASQVSIAKKGSTAAANMRNLVYIMDDDWVVSSPPPNSEIKTGDVLLCVTLRDKSKAKQGQGGKAPLAATGRGGGSNAGDASVEAFKVQYVTSHVIEWENEKGNPILLGLDFDGVKKAEKRKTLTTFLSDLLKPAVIALKEDAKTNAMSQPMIQAKFDAAIVAIDMDQLPIGVSKHVGGKRKREENHAVGGNNENAPDPAAAAPPFDAAGQLEKFFALHTAGALTLEEYQAAKKKCFDRM